MEDTNEILTLIHQQVTNVWYAVGSSVEALRTLQEQSIQLTRIELAMWLLFIQLIIVSVECGVLIATLLYTRL